MISTNSTAGKRPAPDATFQRLDELPPEARLRLGAFRLFSRLLDSAPDAAFFTSLRETELVDELAELSIEAASPAATQLNKLADWLTRAEAPAFEAARRDFLQLFVSTRHLPAPPWESVYCSVDRLVNQEPAREVLCAYAEAQLGFEGMKEVPADHVSLELAFAAALIADSATSPAAAKSLQVFEAEHLARWIPRFGADLANAARSELYRGIGAALPLLLSPASRSRHAE